MGPGESHHRCWPSSQTLHAPIAHESGCGSRWWLGRPDQAATTAGPDTVHRPSDGPEAATASCALPLTTSAAAVLRPAATSSAS